MASRSLQDWAQSAFGLREFVLLVVATALVVAVVAVGLPIGTEYPPGADSSGLNTSLATVQDDQFQQLASFTYTAETVQVTENGTENVTYRVRVNRTTGEALTRKIVGRNATFVTRYSANATVYEQRRNDSGVFYSAAATDASASRDLRGLNRSIRTLAREGNFSYDGRTRLGGSRGYRYTASSLDPVVAGVVPAKNVSATVIIAPDGFVRALRMEYTIATADRDRTQTVVARFSALNRTQVSRPRWVDEATR
jgi:hypothetical protein